MRATMHVEFDQLHGEVRAGGVAAAWAPTGHRGEVRLGGSAGPVMRPVTFAERSVAAADALTAGAPGRSLCGALRMRATVEAGADAAVPGELVDCVVLALAGADDERAPSFAETAISVLRATGGELSSLLDAPAREVDRLATALLAEPAALVGPEAQTLPVGAIRDLLAGALLFRAAAPAGREGTAGVVVPFPHVEDIAAQTWDPVPDQPPTGRRIPARPLGPVALACEPGAGAGPGAPRE
jgi:hypothetical protein